MTEAAERQPQTVCGCKVPDHGTGEEVDICIGCLVEFLGDDYETWLLGEVVGFREFGCREAKFPVGPYLYIEIEVQRCPQHRVSMRKEFVRSPSF